MQTAHEISFLVFPIFLAYAIRLHDISSKVAHLLADYASAPRAEMFEKIIAPKTQGFATFMAAALGATLVGTGLMMYRWYTALGIAQLSLLLTLLMNYLIPGEKTPHYLAVIRKNVRKRLARMDPDDIEEHQALQDISKRLEEISQRKGLFDDKSMTY